MLIFRAMGLPLLGLLMSCMPAKCPRSTLSLPAAATIDTPWLMAYAIALQKEHLLIRQASSAQGQHDGLETAKSSAPGLSGEDGILTRREAAVVLPWVAIPAVARHLSSSRVQVIQCITETELCIWI